MDEFETEQESFWAGDFGDAYIQRNSGEELIASNTFHFAKIFGATGPVESVLELGSNIGLNLRAIRRLLPSARLSAVEINASAARVLREWGEAEVHEGSILEFESDERWDFVFTKGVLIHMAPERLPEVYDLIYQCSQRYICVAEYYNPSPVEIPYRGHHDRLFKRDFAGELIDRFDLRLVDYGFAYHLDSVAPQDDLTWFVLERSDL